MTEFTCEKVSFKPAEEQSQAHTTINSRCHRDILRFNPTVDQPQATKTSKSHRTDPQLDSDQTPPHQSTPLVSRTPNSTQPDPTTKNQEPTEHTTTTTSSTSRPTPPTMGFTTGFIGGLTATYTILYMSLYLHRTNRESQRLLLTQQKTLLTSLHEPPTTVTDSPAYEVRKVGLAEELKDRWNREVETAVRNLQETDWDAVRVRWERTAGSVWGKVKGSEVGQRVGENFVVAAEDVKDGVEKGVKDATGGKRLLEIK